MNLLVDITKHTIEITSLVFVMMLIIEYLNILTSGTWQKKIAGHKWLQYLIAAMLGGMPGCLGAFMVVTMYTHRMVTFGALMTAMIATIGDETFIMLAMIPEKALMIIGMLILSGIIIGIIIDFILKNTGINKSKECAGLPVEIPPHCTCYPKGEILSQLKNCSPARGILSALIIIFLFYFLIGNEKAGHGEWLRITVIITMSAALFIILTVPEHFLEEHLWNHIAKRHFPRIFLWTFGALLIMHLSIEQLGLNTISEENNLVFTAIAGLVGLIPESGPHIFFITSYVNGIIPLSVLLVNSFVQDGHGMLPLLAYSRKDFILVKTIKLAFALSIGYLFLFLGF